VTRVRRLALGGAATAAVVAAVALFSAWPSHRTIPPGAGILKLSFVHGGDRQARCRPLTRREIDALPPNMRRKEICERGRPPVYVEIEVDGAILHRASLAPGGIAGDGPSSIYERFVLPAGRHDVAVRLRDTARAEGFDHAAERRVSLAAGQNLVIDFLPAAGGFVFK